MPRTFGSIDEFRQAAQSSEEPIADAHVLASFDTEVKASEDNTRALNFVISTQSVDRMGDTISAEGWELADYKKNPVVLWAHDASMLPVARAASIRVEDGKLKATAQFTPEGLAKFNDTVFEMYKQGFLFATSVGFLPLKYSFTDDPQRRFGVDFLSQILLEFSCVPVPANAEALIEGRAAGIDIAPVLDWCAAQLDDERLIDLAEKIAARKDLFSRACVERLADAAGLRMLTPEMQKQLADFQSEKTRERLRKKRERELEVVRARG